MLGIRLAKSLTHIANMLLAYYHVDYRLCYPGRSIDNHTLNIARSFSKSTHRLHASHSSRQKSIENTTPDLETLVTHDAHSKLKHIPSPHVGRKVQHWQAEAAKRIYLESDKTEDPTFALDFYVGGLSPGTCKRDMTYGDFRDRSIAMMVCDGCV